MVHEDFVDGILRQLRDEFPERDARPIEIITRLGRLSALLRRRIVASVDAHGVGEVEYNVLAALRRSGPPYQLTPTDLYRAMLLTSGGMTSVLDRLEVLGLVERRPDPSDRRRILVGLTERGRRTHEVALDSHIKACDEVLAGLSQPQKSQLAGLLRRLLLSVEGGAEGVVRNGTD